MSEHFDVSIIISTYNRCDILPAALESIIAQDTGGVRYEIIVVDNNSTDATRRVIESFIARGTATMRYFFEGQQGLSYGWNTGIAQARAPIIALTDDDIWVPRDWVANLKRAFDEYPTVDFIGSRILPQWPCEPPAWLTCEHWAPLALPNYGDAPVYSNAENPICLLGKSFRREVFERFGLFRHDLGRIKGSVGSMEDHELQQRIWNAGRQGVYIPYVVVTAPVQMERMTKAYHRKWHTGHGHFFAVMRDGELEISDARLFDVPAHIYRQALKNIIGWFNQLLRGNTERAFMHESELRFFLGFYRQRRKEFVAQRPRGTLREVALFLRALTRSKLNRKIEGEVG